VLTSRRPAPRLSWVGGRRGGALLVAVVLAAIGVMWLAAGFVSLPGAEGWGYDFEAYADAAVRLAETGTLYQPETLGGPYAPGPHGLYIYAPPLGVAIWPLTSLEPGAAAGLWYLIHVAVLATACALMPVSPPLRLSTFGVAALSFAVIHDIVLGNVSVLLLLPLAAAWRWLDQPMGSIAQAIAMSVRPMLGVLLIWQLLRRRWRAVAWTMGAGMAIVALTLPVVGASGYLDYVTVLRNLGGVTGVEFNYDLSSSLVLLGVAESAATFALLGGFAMAVAAISLSLQRDREVGFMVTITASLLLSPLLWDHYLAMLVLPAVFLASRGRPWALALPMLSWLPGETLPFVVLLATWLPFLAKDGQGGAALRPHVEPTL
jgi:hypothetical protein